MTGLAGGDAESAFFAAGDSVRLHYLRWPSRQSPPSAVVVFLHGIASHAGWFAETAADLNRQGVEVYRAGPPWLGPQRRAARPPGPLRARARRRRATPPAGRRRASGRAGLPGRLELGGQARQSCTPPSDRRRWPGCCCSALDCSLGSASRHGAGSWSLPGTSSVRWPRLPIPLTPELYTANPPYRDFIRADPLRLLQATRQFFWETARLDRRRRDRHRSPGASGPPAPGRGRRDDGRARHAALVRRARGRPPHLPGISRAPAIPWTSSPTGRGT